MITRTGTCGNVNAVCPQVTAGINDTDIPDTNVPPASRAHHPTQQWRAHQLTCNSVYQSNQKWLGVSDFRGLPGFVGAQEGPNV